jgi:hypothetical protein
MRETLGSIRAKIIRKMKETPDVDSATDAINFGVVSLWHTLIQANVGEYVNRQPVALTLDSDYVPYDEPSAEEFLVNYALGSLRNDVHEYDQSDRNYTQAERLRAYVISETVLKTPRQTDIEPFDIYAKRRRNV